MTNNKYLIRSSNSLNISRYKSSNNRMKINRKYLLLLKLLKGTKETYILTFQAILEKHYKMIYNFKNN